MTERRGRVLATVATLLMLLTLSVPGLAAPVQPLHPVEGLAIDPPPEVTAEAWILFDDTYDLVLASENADDERAMASTTKIMTAMVAFEESTPDQTVIVSQRAADVGEAEVPLVQGEDIEIGSLTTGLLVRSANDAAIAVAEGVADSVGGFVDLMNAKAAELGLEHTHFANPHGLDQQGHYTSAADLLAMARAAMEIPEFSRAVSSHVYRFPADPNGVFRVVQNTNMLLWDYDGAIGVKTGYTFQAGRCLVAAAERDGRRIYAVVLGSDGEFDHFADAEALLDYGFESFGLVPLIVEGESYGVQRSGTVVDPLMAAATVEAFMHIAGAGLFTPELQLVGGRPVLVAEGQDLEASIEADPGELPSMSEAFSWFSHWFGQDSEAGVGAGQ